MFDDVDDGYTPARNFFGNIYHYFRAVPIAPRAVMIFMIPFIFVDFWNYYSAGVALVLSAPILALLYAGCGSLAAKFANDEANSHFVQNGAASGALLWLVSTLVNTLISLGIGAASLGTTLLLGVPYLCFCAPLNLILGGSVGALGGAIYYWFHSNRPSDYY